MADSTEDQWNAAIQRTRKYRRSAPATAEEGAPGTAEEAPGINSSCEMTPAEALATGVITVTEYAWWPDGPDQSAFVLYTDQGDELELPLSAELRTRITEPQQGPPTYCCTHADGIKLSFTLALTNNKGNDSRLRIDKSCCRHLQKAVGASRHGPRTDRFNWLLRQYSSVQPYDQNHEQAEYNPTCCCWCVESSAKLTHTMFDCTSHVLACMLTCGCYPTVNTSELVHIPVSSTCEHVCWNFWHLLDDVTSRILACVALPTRWAGWCCGNVCRTIIPAVQEQFLGPPPELPKGCCPHRYCCCGCGCTMARAAFDIGGGLGNRYGMHCLTSGCIDCVVGCA